MSVLEWIRFLVGAALIVSGLFAVVSAVVGNYRFRFVLSRMQAASLGDTLGILLTLGGVMVLSGFTVLTLKLVLIILFWWITSPVAGHLLVNMEISMGNRLDK